MHLVCFARGSKLHYLHYITMFYITMFYITMFYITSRGTILRTIYLELSEKCRKMKKRKSSRGIWTHDLLNLKYVALLQLLVFRFTCSASTMDTSVVSCGLFLTSPLLGTALSTSAIPILAATTQIKLVTLSIKPSVSALLGQIGFYLETLFAEI